jgi:glycosyltransferase involved in cell wall biosynthesis
MFGKIVGRFYLKQDLGLDDDDTPDTVTISELIETFPLWPQWVNQLPHGKKQLFTMFETSDVHPDIIKNMKLFDKVIVPYDYLKNILTRHGVNCEALNWYTSPLIRSSPRVIKKIEQKNKRVFLYIGTNDVRKNLVKLSETFKEVLEGTDHKLIVKTNKMDNLPESKNIKYITNRLSYGEMAGLYNMCDYVVSFSHGEGVGLPMLEAKYFGKPVISHDGGVLSTIKDDTWIILPHEEVSIDKTNVPNFLLKVFHGTWWEVVSKEALRIINNLIQE